MVYRVHGSLFAAHSQLWKGKIEDQGVYAQVELKDISTAELDAFLSVLYPSCVSTPSACPDHARTFFRSYHTQEERTLESWTHILRMAHLWEFRDIRLLAMDKLRDRAPPVDRLVLARQYDIPSWVETARSELRARKDSLTLFEAQRLDIEDVVNIYSSREVALTRTIESMRESLEERPERSVRSLFDESKKR